MFLAISGSSVMCTNFANPNKTNPHGTVFLKEVLQTKVEYFLEKVFKK